MNDQINEKEFNRAVASTFSGSGKLIYNNTIRKLRSILLNRYGYTSKQLIQEFKSYFFAKEFHKKWRPELCKLDTFLLSCVRIFLLKQLKEKDTYYNKTYSVSETKYPFVSNSSSMCYKHEGKWTQIQSMYYENQEDEYMLAELEHAIYLFHEVKGYNSTYLQLFLGEIKISEASASLGVSRITVIRAITKYRLDLYEYLSALGYLYEDLIPLFSGK